MHSRPPEKLGENPTPRPPPRFGEGEQARISPSSPPPRFGEGVGGWGPSTDAESVPAGGPRDDTDHLAGLDTFRQRRRAVFYPKADRPETPAPAGEVGETERQ